MGGGGGYGREGMEGGREGERGGERERGVSVLKEEKR